MHTEIEITVAAAIEAKRLLEQCLANGCNGFDPALIRQVSAALDEADRIVIGEQA